MNDVAAIILAAGKGTRMRSGVPKPLVTLAGKPIVRYVIEALEGAGVTRIAAVIGHGARAMRTELGDRYALPYQAVRSGTADAVACAEAVVGGARSVFVFVGDSPLLEPVTIRRLHRAHLDSGAACSFLTAEFGRPFPYARIIRRSNGTVRRVVEVRDAARAELDVTELLSSHFIFDKSQLYAHLAEIRVHPRTGERYLTDVVNVLSARGHAIEAVPVSDWRELVGLNTPEDLAWAEQVLASRSRTLASRTSGGLLEIH